MNAETHIKEKQRLSQALNGEDRLEKLVIDITNIFRENNLDVQLETAFDIMVFTLESIHLGKFTISDFLL